MVGSSGRDEGQGQGRAGADRAAPLLQDLLGKLERREAVVGIIGLGYVGLPLAVTFAEAGYRVIGIDVDAAKAQGVNRHESHIADVPSETLERLAGRIQATTDFDALGVCDTVSICVPTPLSKTGDPDISYIVGAADAIARRLRPGVLVVLESTTYPGTTTEVILPRLCDSGQSLRIGMDFFVCFSPERVDPGRTDWTTRNTPKVVGGVTAACLRAGMALYGSAIETIVPVSCTEAAETVKLLENTFRAVNIGLVNEALLMCERMGLDVWEVIDAAATKPFGFMKFTPGPGLGGHCIPIDPLYLSWKLRTLNYQARFIELASEVNSAMPRYWAERAQDLLNDARKPLRGSSILVLGVAYKRDVSDVRESPAVDIIRLLSAKGAQVEYHDPHVPALHHDDLRMESTCDLDWSLERADLVLVATDHSHYDWERIRGRARLLLDTRGATRLAELVEICD